LPIALLGLPLALIGFVAGGLVVRQVGAGSRTGKVLFFTMALSLGVGARIVTKAVDAVSKYGWMFRQ